MSFLEMNTGLFRLINNLGKEYTLLNPPMIFIAEYLVYFLAAIVLAFWLTRKERNRIMIICGTITFVFAEIIGKLSGKLYSNHQPFAELSNVNQLIEKTVDNSFPSDHTILFFSFCVSIWLFRKGLWFLLIIIACLVGISRIWVGVHYPADIFAGAIISVISATFVFTVLPKLKLTYRLLDFYERFERLLIPSSTKTKGTKSKDL